MDEEGKRLLRLAQEQDEREHGKDAKSRKERQAYEWGPLKRKKQRKMQTQLESGSPEHGAGARNVEPALTKLMEKADIKRNPKTGSVIHTEAKYGSPEYKHRMILNYFGQRIFRKNHMIQDKDIEKYPELADIKDGGLVDHDKYNKLLTGAVAKERGKKAFAYMPPLDLEVGKGSAFHNLLFQSKKKKKK